ncbi:MAG: DUF554 domain-containing protein [Sarcina ventriculi]|uniref:Protein of uncharacterized function (DUF554) n=1 Tax=Sarcina ventriculi TaxID=1267 RepID=A0ABM9UQJ1_SARVE|nr:DUF554 domain-containing protein [Sarcina ventriculi]MDO4401873.1 DUF554 domain-containing protein [Clostridiaceae bacterium]MDY6058117.1 DUF554 domain-containing protein [Candidatus Onthovivens sp.]MBU5322792.1 DUF554 domain-containing protein [Sarcina ventriculi]MCI5636059.1 DUF554 domain-containing protein [Sarcina ventriculi]MDD7374229.1 DUF554 domain-containing protein [Sarcina ventriculi]
MIGTIVNCTAIIIGSILGTILKNGIKEKYKDIMLKAMGLSAALLGVSSAVKGINDSNYPVLFIISLAIGGLIGEALALEKRVNNLTSKFSKGNLVEGLSTAVLLFCAGALSILGPLESALNGNNTLLYTNAILDGITSVVLASNYGIGIGISAFVLFIWQGSIYLCADIISPYITPALLNEISIVGGVLILSSGLNILQIKKINVLNLLPSLLVPVTYFFIKSLI